MPNFSLLACLEVVQKFVVGVVSGFQVANVSYLNPSCIELGLGFSLDNGSFPLIFDEGQGLMEDGLLWTALKIKTSGVHLLAINLNSFFFVQPN